MPYQELSLTSSYLFHPIADDEEVECPPESLISKSVLAELCGETAKLKSLGVLNQVGSGLLFNHKHGYMKLSEYRY